VLRNGDASSARCISLFMNRTPQHDVPGLIAAGALRSTLLRQWQLFMQQHTLVLCPVAMEPALPYGVDLESDASLDRLCRSHTFLFATALLGLPCVSVPTGVVDGVPMGVQIIGPRFREDLVLQAAEAIEARCGAFTPIDPRVAGGPVAHG
jgi:amidase